MGAWFFIDDVLVHEMLPTTAPFAATLSVPITATSVNSGSGTESGSLDLWNAIVNRMGRAQTEVDSYYHATGTDAGAILKRGPGQLHTLAIGLVANTCVITLYDNTAASGTVLWASGAIGAQTKPFTVALNAPFHIGLTLVVATANATLTVTYE